MRETMLARLLLFISLCCFAPPSAALPVYSDGVTIPADGAVRSGRLANGLTYVIANTQVEPGTVRVTLDIAVGNASEHADEIEIAHLLEHMLANRYIDSEGRKKSTKELATFWKVDFGNEVGANTQDNVTKFWYQAPAEEVDKALGIVRAIAFGFPLTASELETERGLVASELTSIGKDWGEIAELGRAFGPEARRSIRPSDRVRSTYAMPFEKVTRFYSDWYRPENETLYIIGDIDPAGIERKITDLFAARLASSGKRLESTEVTLRDEAYVAVPSPVANDIIFRIGFARSISGVERDQADIHAALAEIINQRFKQQSRRFGYPVYDLHASLTDQFLGRGLAFGIRARTRPTDYEKAIREVYGLLASVASEGVSPVELRHAKDSILKANTLDEKKTLPSVTEEYSQGILSDISKKKINTVPSSQADIGMVTSLKIQQEAARVLRTRNERFIVFGPRAMSSLLEDEFAVRAWLDKGRHSIALKPPVSSATDLVAPKLPKTASGPAIVTDAGFGVRKVRFPHNGIALFLVPSKNEDVQLQVLQPRSSAMLEDREFSMISQANIVFDLNGAGGLNKYQLEHWLSGKNMQSNVRLGVVRSRIEIFAKPDNLDSMFSLIAHYLSVPTVAQSTIAEARLESEKQRSLVESDQTMSFDEYVDSVILRPHLVPYVASSRQITSSQAEGIWKNQFGDFDNLAFTLAGNFDENEVVALSTKYLAPLRPLKSRTASLGLLPGGPYRISGGRSDSAQVDIRILAPLAGREFGQPTYSALSKILSKRIFERLRNQEGKAYIPTAGIVELNTLDLAQIVIKFSTNSDAVDELINASWDEVRALQKGHFSREEMDIISASIEPSPSTVTINDVIKQFSYNISESTFDRKNLTPSSKEKISELINLFEKKYIRSFVFK